MSLSTVFETEPGRWNDEVGLVAGNMAGVLIAAVESVSFGLWLRWRGSRAQGRWWVALVAGLAHPLLAVGIAESIFVVSFPLGDEYVGPTAVPLLSLVGLPIGLAEVVVRAGRPVAWKKANG
jgi:hypothetical protein